MLSSRAANQPRCFAKIKVIPTPRRTPAAMVRPSMAE
ncbi:hypothetical protein X734_15235 [Mesorhizobium sp. L2C084A000]|nr:hypothetical protein X734_15235 [Mesorhizobium sp. L2C084A000]